MWKRYQSLAAPRGRIGDPPFGSLDGGVGTRLIETDERREPQGLVGWKREPREEFVNQCCARIVPQATAVMGSGGCCDASGEVFAADAVERLLSRPKNHLGNDASGDGLDGRAQSGLGDIPRQHLVDLA